MLFEVSAYPTSGPLDGSMVTCTVEEWKGYMAFTLYTSPLITRAENVSGGGRARKALAVATHLKC